MAKADRRGNRKGRDNFRTRVHKLLIQEIREKVEPYN